MTTLNPLAPTTLRRAFGAFPSGVVSVAARVDEALVGMAASSFTSVSLEPALVSFSVANTSATWPVLRKADRLGLSVLAAHHDAVCRQLAGPAERRFDGLALRTSEAGAVLLSDAVASFECSLHEEIPAGDHTMVLLRLHAFQDSGSPYPLVFHRSGFRRIQDEAIHHGQKVS